MLQLTGRFGARRAGKWSQYLVRDAAATANNAPSMLATGLRRHISSSPRHVQQAAAARVMVEEQYEANPPQPQNDPYWQRIGIWKDVPEDKFLNYQWQVSHFAPTYHPLPLSN